MANVFDLMSAEADSVFATYTISALIQATGRHIEFRAREEYFR